MIPGCYRRHFPEALKSHRSHDIVLLCLSCHERAHTVSVAAASAAKSQIFRSSGVVGVSGASQILCSHHRYYKDITYTINSYFEAHHACVAKAIPKMSATTKKYSKRV